MKTTLLLIILTQSLGALAQSGPSISANALILYQNSNLNRDDNSTKRNGVELQETEIAFYSDVDPYHKLNVLLTVAPKYEFDTAAQKVNQTWAVEPETLYMETTQLPGATLKAGKFKAAFGKHNQLHAHNYPFVEAPLANSKLLGDEGLNDFGISVAGLLPLSWFSELTLQGLRGEGENSEFNSTENGDSVGLVRWTNLWDLSEEHTLEIGFSGAQGKNYLNTKTQLSSIDLTFKWRPLSGGKYQSWTIALEGIQRQIDQPSTLAESSKGGTLWAQYQFAQRWQIGGRIEDLKTENSDSALNSLALPNYKSSRSTLAITFQPSEFSSYRLELGQGELPPNLRNETTEKRIALQTNFTIGAHPSHGY